MINKFEKVSSVKVSEKFFSRLEELLYKSNLNGYYDVFNNCRETGYILKIYDNQKELNIWACEARNSDQIMIVLGDDKEKDTNNLFSDEAFKEARYFKCDDYNSAVDYVYQQIKYMYKDEIVKESHIKYDRFYTMAELKKICADAEDLGYEDYYDMATFWNEDEKYFCDLVIIDGSIGYRYSIKNEYGDYENLYFEKLEPNLEDDTSLMLDMKEKLSNFIDMELQEKLESYTQNIKI